MRAVVCQNQKLSVRELPEPEPGPGQVLVAIRRCGICGSDLHLRHHLDDMKRLLAGVGAGDLLPGNEDPIVFGHEYCAEILDFGPGCRRKLRPGTRVVSQGAVRVGDRIELAGLSKTLTGGYAERMLLQEVTLVPVPDDLSPDVAALTEPMAVGTHAVRRSEIRKGDVAIVIGCGPVGLAVICLLKARGVATVVASDFSPGRRDLAKRCGADVVLDPAESSPFATGKDYGFVTEFPALVEMGLGAMEAMAKLPVPWWHVWRLAELVGAANLKRPVVFECVGVPGILQQIIAGAPIHSRVVVVGVCMPMDTIQPALAIQKEIDLRFVLGHTPLEFRDTLELLARGKVRCEAMITGKVGLEGVGNAFDTLADPERHAKILVDPQSDATTPSAP